MPLACSRRHLGGSEPMRRARQFSQLFLGCIFKERPAQMEMEKPPAWFHWSFLFLVNLAALFAWKSLPTEEGVCRHQCFSVVAQATAQGQPKGYFQLKELHRTTKPYSQMNADWKVAKAQYAEFNVPTCGKIAVWHSLGGTVMTHDGLNLTCLDQCHGVRSHGTSSSQGWRKRIVVQSKFVPWVYILVFAQGNSCRFAWEAFPRNRPL